MSATADRDVLEAYRAKNAIWTPSNAISLLRVFLTIPTGYYITTSQLRIAALLCVLAFITDLLDGYIARKTNDVSELGKVIDPIADKLFVAVTVLVMLLESLLPLWFIVTVIARDALILIVGIWATRKFKVVLPSNYPGKGAVLAISLTLFLTLLGAHTVVLGFMQVLSLGLMLLSLIVYGQRLFGLLRQTAGA